MDITTIIIAGNEQDIIKKAIDSLYWCKNIILVAANSTDNTVTTVKLLRTDTQIIEVNDTYGKNFGKWRNLGLAAVKTTNLLYLDADEQVTKKLQKEIELFCKQTTYTYGAIPRKNLYLGKAVSYGGSYPDYQKRIFKKNSITKWINQMHEQPSVTGRLLHFSHPMTHNTHRDLFSMTQKTLLWTDVLCQKLISIKHPEVYSWRLFRIFFTKFLYRYILQKMWKDGLVGYISSVFESYDSTIIYSKLWETQKK